MAKHKSSSKSRRVKQASLPKRVARVKVRGALGASAIALVDSPRGGTMLRVRKWLEMPRETFSRLAGVSVRTLAEIETGGNLSEKVQRKVVEVRRIVEALRDLIAEKAVGPWLQAPNDAFGGAKPLEVIERGESDRIWQMIYTLRSGGVS